MAKPKFEGVGLSRVHHAAIEVMPGMLDLAVELFEGLDLIPTRTSEGDWGKAIFMASFSIPLQLSESNSGKTHESGETHVAIRVDNPRLVAQSAQDWANQKGHESICLDMEDGKVLLVMPTLLMADIELIP